MTKEHIKDWDWNMSDGFNVLPLSTDEDTLEQKTLTAVSAALDIVHFRLCGTPNKRGVDIWRKPLNKSRTRTLSDDLLSAIGHPQKVVLVAKFDFSDHRLLSVRNKHSGILFLMNKEIMIYSAYIEKPEKDIWIPMEKPVNVKIDSVLPVLQEEAQKSLNWY